LKFKKHFGIGYGQDSKLHSNRPNPFFDVEISDSSFPDDLKIVEHPVIFHKISGGHTTEPGELVYGSWFASMRLAEQFLDPVPAFLEIKLENSLRSDNEKEQKLMDKLWVDFGSLIFGKVSHLEETESVCFKDLLVGTMLSEHGWMKTGAKAYFLHNPTLRRMRDRARDSSSIPDALERPKIDTLKILFIEKKTSLWWRNTFVNFDNVKLAFKEKYPNIPLVEFVPEKTSMKDQIRMYTSSMISVSQSGGIGMFNFLLPNDAVEIIVATSGFPKDQNICGDEDFLARNTISYVSTYRYCFYGKQQLKGREPDGVDRTHLNVTKFMKLIDMSVQYQCRENAFSNC